MAYKFPDKPLTVVPWLQVGNPTEYASIQSGAVFEWHDLIYYNGNDTNANKAAFLDSKYTALNLTIPNLLRTMLRFWGLDRNV